MARGSAQPQEVPTTHQNIMFPRENLQWTISVIRRTVSQHVRAREAWSRNIKDTAHLDCRFPLIHMIHQRIYKACYLNTFFSQNDNTVHEYSCTLLTYPNSNEIIMCRLAPRKSMKKFHFIIILSSIDRNKFMQYSSSAFIGVSDLAPSLGWGQWERPEVRLRFPHCK